MAAWFSALIGSALQLGVSAQASEASSDARRTVTIQPQDLQAILRPLPPNSPFRAALTAFVSSDKGAEAQGRKALKPLSRPYWEEPIRIEESEALAALRATLDLQFPKPKTKWENRGEEVLFVLFGSAYPSLLDIVEERYAKVDPQLRPGLLTLVASAGSRRGAELLVTLVKLHGWPGFMYGRFTTELGRTLQHADALFPSLLDIPGGPWIELADLALRALRQGTLSPSQLERSKQFRELTPLLERLLTEHRALRGRDSEAMTDDERSVSFMLAEALDLAGFVGGPEVVPALRSAVDLPEALPAAFAIATPWRQSSGRGGRPGGRRSLCSRASLVPAQTARRQRSDSAQVAHPRRLRRGGPGRVVVTPQRARPPSRQDQDGRLHGEAEGRGRGALCLALPHWQGRLEGCDERVVPDPIAGRAASWARDLLAVRPLECARCGGACCDCSRDASGVVAREAVAGG